MKKTTFTSTLGPAPGRGERHTRENTRRDDDAVARKQIQDLLLVSNVSVVSKAITHLGIRPAHTGFFSRSGYKNGGTYGRFGTTEYFSREVVQIIRDELDVHSEPLDDRKQRFRYRSVTYTQYED